MNDDDIPGLIDYLLEREFGRLIPPQPFTLHGASRNRASEGARWQRAQAKRAEYQAMPADQIRELGAAAQKADVEAREAKVKKGVAELFFNRPGTDADLAHYAKMATWSLDEAVALSLGKNPRAVNRAAMKDAGRYPPEAWHYSPFPSEYTRRSELVRRAHEAYELSEPTTPADFLAWAKYMDIPCPPELEAEVTKRAPIADVRKELEAATARIAELERELSEAQDAAAHRWPWGSYETELLRILAAAVERFWVGYDPADPSTANTNDTVRDWLKEQGVADRNAEVMAKIIRVDGLRPGPR